MTRFWITLQQGVDFVLSSLGLMNGGEIFIPRIPSMKMTDMAEALAPGIPHEIVGIRPGEKLHETMIPWDDSRHTVKLKNCYIIEPAFASWDHKSHLDTGAEKVGNDFSYASNTNNEWLDEKDLKETIKTSIVEKAA